MIERSYLEEVVEHARAGDSNAFAELYAATFQTIYQKVYLILDNEYMTQDVMLYTYVDIKRRIGQVEHAKDFFPLLESIALEKVNEQCALYDRKRVKSIEPKSRLSKAPTMSTEIADQLLEYIFFASDSFSNDVPLATLLTYLEYRSQRFVVQRIVLGVLLVMMLTIPYWMLSPDFTLTETTSNNLFAYQVDIEGWMGIDTVTASVNGVFVPVTREAARTYMIYPTANGEMTVIVTYVNHRPEKRMTVVSDVDRAAPIIDSTSLNGGILTIYAHDEESSIDYKNITASDSDGNTILPSDYDSATGEIIFEDFPGRLTITIPDLLGNKKELTVTE